MKLVDLAKPRKVKAKRVMGIDANTHCLAFCVMENRRPRLWGKIDFEGQDVYERMADAAKKVAAFATMVEVDYIVFESAILAKVANADVTIKLAMVYGVCIAALMNEGTEVRTVKPLEWQAYIGNPNFTKAEKDKIKQQYPGKSASWYQTHIRALRKQRTLDFFNSRWPDMDLSDDDVGDASGIAYWAYRTLTER